MDEPEGFVEWATFEAVVDGVAGPADEGGPADEDGPGTIAFMGLGEPLLHPRFPDMVRAAKERGLRTEVTTNALLLDDTMAAALLEAGLDQLVVSIDGASAEAFGRVRGVSLSRVVENVSRLHDGRGPNYSSRGRSSAAPSSGAYRLVRHPMYGGVLPLALGWALVFDPAEWHDGAGGSSGGALDLAHRE